MKEKLPGGGCLAILMIVLLSHIGGACIVGGIMSGIPGFMGGPYIALFGIFVLPIELTAILIECLLFADGGFLNRKPFVTCSVTAAAGAVIALLILVATGALDDARYVIAFSIAGAYSSALTPIWFLVTVHSD
jgi:hypothetical protein